MTPETFNIISCGWILIGIVAFPFLLRQTAPYGRHTTEGWGPMISNQIGWMIQEGVAPIFISIWFWLGHIEKTHTSYFFYSLYMAHYIYRSYIFPFRTKTQGKKIPLVICGSAVFFNACNTFILGYFLGNIGGNYSDEYFLTPRFFLGFAIFLSGVFINVKRFNPGLSAIGCFKQSAVFIRCPLMSGCRNINYIGVFRIYPYPSDSKSIFKTHEVPVNWKQSTDDFLIKKSAPQNDFPASLF